MRSETPPVHMRQAAAVEVNSRENAMHYKCLFFPSGKGIPQATMRSGGWTRTLAQQEKAFECSAKNKKLPIYSVSRKGIDD